ncbi:MAG: hypothetical protein IJX81_02890 [Clostridia bacterium]|nr:hypothetical protein [Clostridia bacterium]
MRGYACKEFFKTAISLAAFLLMTASVAFLRDPFLLSQAQGVTAKKSYYLYSSSSCAKEVDEASLLELPFIEGESVSLVFPSEAEAGVYVKRLVEAHSAALQKVEFLDGVVSYYAFTGIGESVRVSGLPVDLHIAVKGATVSVGKPIIFGGY